MNSSFQYHIYIRHISYQSFVSKVSKPSKAKETRNVVNPPSITGDNNKRIIDIFYIPEMHMMTGNVEKQVMEMERSQTFIIAAEGTEVEENKKTSQNVSRGEHQV